MFSVNNIFSIDILYELIFHLKYPDIKNLLSSNKYLYSCKHHSLLRNSLKIKYYQYTYNSLTPLLINSCLFGDYSMIQSLISLGLDPSIPSTNTRYVKVNNSTLSLPTSKDLIPPTVNIQFDNTPNLAIRIAHQYGHTNIVSFLLKDKRVAEQLSPIQLFLFQSS